MKIFYIQKSLDSLKHFDRHEFDLNGDTPRAFITEMVTRNFLGQNKNTSLEDCITLALNEFQDGSFLLVNKSKDYQYKALDEPLMQDEADEFVFIKLKYLRGMLWN